MKNRFGIIYLLITCYLGHISYCTNSIRQNILQFNVIKLHPKVVLRIPSPSCQPLHVLYHGPLYPPGHHVSLDLDRKLALEPLVPL